MEATNELIYKLEEDTNTRRFIPFESLINEKILKEMLKIEREKSTAFAIKIIIGKRWETRSRYFNSFSKKGRLCSAWYLAGAKLFIGENCEKLEKIKKKLEAKKIKFEITKIEDLPF